MLRYGSSKLSLRAGGGTAGIAQLGMAHLSMFLAPRRRDRPVPILGDQLLLARREIRVELCPVGLDPIVPMVVQIGQSSSGIFASAFRSGAPSHAAMEPRHENSTAAGNSYCKCPTWKPDR